jgi:glycosyltransferase involved in cell wall biosynthesis
MASGAAVITSHVSSLPEVGGDAVEYVDPADEGSIAAALERLLRSRDERERLARAAKQRAETFSWDRVAKALLYELEGAAGRRR